jgi:magnesium transporter
MEPADHDVLKELEALLGEDQDEALDIFLRLVRAEDIAQWLDHLTVRERLDVLRALDHTAAGTVLADTTAAVRAQLVDALDPAELARIAEAMPPDEAADLIGDLGERDGELVLEKIAPADEKVIRGLLQYPEDSAGGIMNPNVVALSSAATVDDALNTFRTAPTKPIPGPVWVVNDDGVLVGFVRVHDLITRAPDERLATIMDPEVISVEDTTDQEDVADLVERYDLVAVPVVDAHARLLGAITVDDVLDVIEEEASEDIYLLAGSSVEEEESESILHVARYRLPWLLVCLAGTQLSTTVMKLSSGTVPVFEHIAIFTPAILAMGGNTSLQSSTTTVRRLALDTLPRSRYLRHVAREVLVALLMGLSCGTVESVVALGLGYDPAVGLAVGLAMTLGMSAASLLGAAMPLVLTVARVDPAVASGPLVSTINDSLGLAVYFTIATFVMTQLG